MEQTAEQPTCEERVSAHRDSRLDDLRRLWAAYQGQAEECEECEGSGECGCANENGCPKCDGTGGCAKCDGTGEIQPSEDGDLEDLGNIHEYGLAFDYVAPDTFTDQEEPYFRYQISWGGPSEEIRFYASGQEYDWQTHRVEFWFLDWFDGASRTLHGDDRKLADELFEWFASAGSCQAQYDEATA